VVELIADVGDKLIGCPARLLCAPLPDGLTGAVHVSWLLIPEPHRAAPPVEFKFVQFVGFASEPS